MLTSIIESSFLIGGRILRSKDQGGVLYLGTEPGKQESPLAMASSSSTNMPSLLMMIFALIYPGRPVAISVAAKYSINISIYTL